MKKYKKEIQDVVKTTSKKECFYAHKVSKYEQKEMLKEINGYLDK